MVRLVRRSVVDGLAQADPPAPGVLCRNSARCPRRSVPGLGRGSDPSDGEGVLMRALAIGDTLRIEIVHQAVV